MITRIFLFYTILAVLLTSCASTPSAVDTVKIFESGYGTAHMDKASHVTTAEFREGKPRSLWVSETWDILYNLEYKKLESDIVETQINKDKAVITTNATIQTLGGKATQVEVYILRKQNRHWLIDELHITDEKVKPDKTAL